MRPALRCLVWELDNTVWDGAVCDGTSGALRPAALHTLNVLGERGIRHAVASRGAHEWTFGELLRHGVCDMFSPIEIGWGPKSSAISRIARQLAIGPEVIGFIDDEPVERAEVARSLPEVRCFAARNVDTLPLLPDFRPISSGEAAPTPPLGFARVPSR
ncbi:HAD-IIIC family phosphatase [Nocardia sp. CNY236]|uniref:HAD-IIIC family phosphatase n=1 Tax=Nocardia sp. CNY236 TaxID=1169152 RepID=UPI00041EA76C|nr:HAD-IIIC family phosphatase [Nocardia sp. CNY236]